MKRLVVVSNRVADLSKKSQSGGLAVGLADTIKRSGGLWLGWGGNTTRDRIPEPKVKSIGSVTQATITLSEDDYRDYYLGFSNSVLWPLFHYRLDLVEYRTAYMESYQRVNGQFADALVPLLEPDDLVWIHDYHLIPLAAELRQRGCTQRMGYFLHIPFPSPEILTAVPRHRRLVESLLQFDVIGFQTETDLGNLQRYVENHLKGKIEGDGTIVAGGRRIKAGCFPIGIDVDDFAKMAQTPNDAVQIESMRRAMLGHKQIIGVDRLDYTKGLADRFRAFSRLLEMYPDLRKSVTLMQIATPTREDVEAYAEIREELEALSGSINGRFADFNWVPVHYIHGKVPRDALAALFRASQVGFVTPLRDGMNLVAKEYIAAQDPRNPGVLVLSKFAGAAESLHEALIVNPYDVDDMAKTLCRALTMPLEERRERQAVLIERIRKQDVHHWRDRFLEALESDCIKAA